MAKFHQDVSSIKCPTCTTCIKKFPGLNVGTHTTKCQRCSRDKHVPKLSSEANNMHPGAAPLQLQVITFIIAIQTLYIVFIFRDYHRQRKCLYLHSWSYTTFLMGSTATEGMLSTCHKRSLDLPASFQGYLLSLMSFLFGRKAKKTPIATLESKGQWYKGLCWLRENNKYYHNIDIDLAALNQLPDDGGWLPKLRK